MIKMLSNCIFNYADENRRIQRILRSMPCTGIDKAKKSKALASSSADDFYRCMADCLDYRNKKDS